MRSDDHRFHVGHGIGVALILIVAAALRIHGIGAESLSIDELGSMETAAGRGQVHLTLPRGVLLSPPPVATSLAGARPVWDVPAMMQSDVHPPSYFIALRLWQDVFGGGDVASRSLSAAAGVIGVLLIFDVGRWLADAGVGLCAALLMAVASPQISIAHDVRPYALAMVLVLAAADVLLRVERVGPRRARRIALTAFLCAAGLTHYFVVPVALAMAVYAIVHLRGLARRQVMISFAAAGALALILWGPQAWAQRSNFTNPWMYWFNAAGTDHISNTLRQAMILPLRYLADPPTTATTAASFSAILFLLPWLLCRRMPSIILPGLWLTACVGLVLVLDLCRSTNQLAWIKYTVLAAPAVYLMLPMLQRRGWPRAGLAAAATLYCLLALPQAYHYNNSDLRACIAKYERLSQPDDPVIFAGAGWGDWYTGGLYMGLERYATRMPRSVVLLREPASPSLLTELRERSRPCWMILGWTSQAPDVYMPGWQWRIVDSFPSIASLYKLTPASERTNAQ
jgi:Dolichyl-phosphate-mannose-protein mannosyltransferase